MSFMIEQLFKETLRKNNLYITPERMYIFQQLKEQSSPCTIQELVDVTKNKLDTTTVYRNLEIFEEIGVTTRVYSGWKYKIELSDQFSPHHHHMTCTSCGKLIAFEETDTFIEELKNLEKLHGFKTTTHSLELRGLCSSCC